MAWDRRFSLRRFNGATRSDGPFPARGGGDGDVKRVRSSPSPQPLRSAWSWRGGLPPSILFVSLSFKVASRWICVTRSCSFGEGSRARWPWRSLIRSAKKRRHHRPIGLGRVFDLRAGFDHAAPHPPAAALRKIVERSGGGFISVMVSLEPPGPNRWGAWGLQRPGDTEQTRPPPGKPGR